MQQIQSPLDHIFTKAKMSGPLGNGHAFAVVFEKVVVALVVGLLQAGSPAAIAGLVIAIGVDAIEAFSGRTFSHVGQEVIEVSPPVAIADTSTSVVGEVFDARVVASRFHQAPSTVFARSTQAMRHHVDFPCIADGAAAFRAGLYPQIARYNGALSTTDATASPRRQASLTVSGKHSEGAKGPAGQVEVFHAQQFHTLIDRAT